MKKFSKMMFKLLVVAQILALTLLTACATVGNALGTTTSTNVCHATGDMAIPYEELTVTSAELDEHLEHPNDFSPVPVIGCPTTLAVISEGMIAVCHATGNAAAPYEEFTVSVDGLDGHGVHEGDVFPAAEGGCPTTNPVVTSPENNDKITICHATGSKKNPYNEITVSVNSLNGHGQHGGDIIPAPAGGCPTTK